jgi:RNA polymerase sigma factor (sigma-70 family)
VDEGRVFRDLLARLRVGDPAAAVELQREYGPALRVIVRRHLDTRLRDWFDSIDFVQEVWAAVLTRSPDRLAVASPQELLALLTRVARDKVTDALRKHARQADGGGRGVRIGELEESEGEAGLVSRLPAPDEWAIAEEEWERLVDRLPPGYRVILERLREGCTHEDIARMANVSLSTVNRIVRRLKDLTGL